MRVNGANSGFEQADGLGDEDLQRRAGGQVHARRAAGRGRRTRVRREHNIVMETDRPLALGDPMELVGKAARRKVSDPRDIAGVAWRGVSRHAAVRQRGCGRGRARRRGACSALRERLGPVVDRTEIAMWSWPENRSSAPSPAVHIAGVLVHGDRWRQAIRTAAGFGGFGSTGVIVDSARQSTGYDRLPGSDIESARRRCRTVHEIIYHA